MPDMMPPNERRPKKALPSRSPLQQVGSTLRKGFQLHPDGQKPNKQQVGAHAGYWLLAFVALMFLQTWWAADQSIVKLQYSDFLTMLHDHKIASVQVEGSQLSGTLTAPDSHGRKAFSTTAVPADLQQQLQQAGVSYTGVVPNPFWSGVLSWVLPLLVFYGLWAFGVRRAVSNMGGGGLMSLGQSRAKVFVETDTKTTFADVAGADEAKEELKEIIDFLKSPGTYGVLGAHVPKGVLLVGPPGTGKTLLARAVAGEAGVPFFSISGSEFVEMFVGVGAARVRDLFQQARDQAPAIIFIDELDALGRSRGAFAGVGGHDEKEQTLNQLLVELDGFDSRAGVVLLAATNRPEVLDPALMRAGRFDRQVLVDRPDKGARIAILTLHLGKVKAAANVTADKVADLTPGMTGADLANVVNEAALLATRRGADMVEMSDFNEAVERGIAGLARRTRVLNPVERETVAYHELGHALVAMSLPGTDPVHKVSIIPRGVGALGYTIQRPTEDRFLMSREELQNKMAVLLGGRAAEVIIFHKLSTGAADDLQKVTDIARAMVTRFGMIEELGPVVFEREQHSFLNGPMAPNAEPARAYSDITAQTIDRLIKEQVQDAFQRATGILTSKLDVLHRAAKELLAHESLSAEELAAVTGTVATA